MRLNLFAALTLALTAGACAHDRPEDPRAVEAQLTAAAPATSEQLRVPTPPPAAAVRAELEAAQDMKANSAATAADGGTTTADSATSTSGGAQGTAADAGAWSRATPRTAPTATTQPVPLPLPTAPARSPLTPLPGRPL